MLKRKPDSSVHPEGLSSKKKNKDGIKIIKRD